MTCRAISTPSTPWCAMLEFNIWRIEHGELGHGPYNIDLGGGLAPISGDGAHWRPLPEQDGLKDVPPTWHYGFLTLRQYAEWFGYRSRHDMEASGWVLSLYHCPPHLTKRGEHQVAFYKARARYIRAYAPSFFSIKEPRPIALPQWVDIDRPHIGPY